MSWSIVCEVLSRKYGNEQKVTKNIWRAWREADLELVGLFGKITMQQLEGGLERMVNFECGGNVHGGGKSEVASGK
jgi:hypothetical protein